MVLEAPEQFLVAARIAIRDSSPGVVFDQGGALVGLAIPHSLRGELRLSPR
jgi:hypothetical protein